MSVRICFRAEFIHQGSVLTEAFYAYVPEGEPPRNLDYVAECIVRDKYDGADDIEIITGCVCAFPRVDGDICVLRRNDRGDWVFGGNAREELRRVHGK